MQSFACGDYQGSEAPEPVIFGETGAGAGG